MSELISTGKNYISMQSLWARARCIWLQFGIWNAEIELEAIEQEHNRLEAESRAAILARAALRAKLRQAADSRPESHDARFAARRDLS
jgi:hypothetical protein